MRRLRAALVVAALVASLAPVGGRPTPAYADDPLVLTFDGTASIGCFGCGPSGPEGNSLDATVTAVVDGHPMVGTMWAEYEVDVPACPTCLVSSAARGVLLTEFGDAEFSLGRLGALAVIVYTWRGSGAGGEGVVTFAMTRPPGADTCDRRADFHVTGVLGL